MKPLRDAGFHSVAPSDIEAECVVSDVPRPVSDQTGKLLAFVT